MNATLRNEMRPVIRQRFDVIWCPFCDRSRQETISTPFCDGCGAEFTGDNLENELLDELITGLTEQKEPTRRSRSKPSQQVE